MIIDCFAGGGGASVGIEMALGVPVDKDVDWMEEAIIHLAKKLREVGDLFDIEGE